MTLHTEDMSAAELATWMRARAFKMAQAAEHMKTDCQIMAQAADRIDAQPFDLEAAAERLVEVFSDPDPWLCRNREHSQYNALDRRVVACADCILALLRGDA